MQDLAKKYFPLLAIVALSSCENFRDTSLYAEPAPADNSPHIENVYALNIFSDHLGSENWFSENSNCLQVENSAEHAASGEGGLKLKWNRQGEGCEWTGMGFGWDGWVPKDLSAILDRAAVSFRARSLGEPIKSLPWAVAFEDYSGAQAYAGVFPSCIEGGVIDQNWTNVNIPLSSFDYEMDDFDASIVKQFIIQFEAEGQVEIDELRLIPFSGSMKKMASIGRSNASIVIDGQTADWESSDAGSIPVETAEISLLMNDEFLFVMANVKDESPMSNKQENENIWNGDCIELAISTNADASPGRKFLYMSDQHFGIRINEAPMVWNWRMNKAVPDAKVEVIKTSEGYQMECQIPWSAIGARLEPGKTYDLEIAIDHGNASGVRQNQYRWNNPYAEGFHLNPAMWGEVQIANPKNP